MAAAGSILTLALGVCAAAAAGVLAWQNRDRFRPAGLAAAGAPGLPGLPNSPSPEAPGRQRPRSQLPILHAQALLEMADVWPLVERIRANLGFAQDNFTRDVLPLIHRFAEYVQLLPASESHHHAQPGGLLEHTLEVAAFASALRNGRKLPPRGAAEEQIAAAPAWSYAVVVAALLHDIGKCAADARVELFGADVSRPIGLWNALAGPMPASSDATHYRVGFPEQRDYAAHQRLGLALLHSVAPAHALRWLSGQPALLQGLVGYLDGALADSEAHARAAAESDSGCARDVIAQIVREADRASVAQNLRHGSRIRFATARNPPLIERLMLGLRALFAEQRVSLNRPGATAFVDPDGEHVWLVAGSCAEQTRALLLQREQREEAAAELPADNTRFFDTWAEYGALVQPPKEHGKGSVWWVRVDIQGWSQVLSVLKFPLNRIVPGDASRPAALAGSVTPVAPGGKQAGESTGESTGESPEAAALLQPRDPAPEGADAAVAGTAVAGVNVGTAVANADVAGVAVSAAVMPASLAALGREDSPFLDEGDSSAGIAAAAALAPTQAVRPLRSASGAPRALYRMPGAAPRPNADKFMAWVQHGLGCGDLAYNEADALIHFVAEGMLLVTPRIFRVYLETNPFVGSIGASKDELRALQQEVQKAGYIGRNPHDNSNFHFFQTQATTQPASGEQESKRGAVINCYLIPNPQAYVRPVPAPNALLRRCARPEKPARAAAPPA